MFCPFEWTRREGTGDFITLFIHLDFHSISTRVDHVSFDAEKLSRFPPRRISAERPDADSVRPIFLDHQP